MRVVFKNVRGTTAVARKGQAPEGLILAKGNFACSGRKIETQQLSLAFVRAPQIHHPTGRHWKHDSPYLSVRRKNTSRFPPLLNRDLDKVFPIRAQYIHSRVIPLPEH